ncbi:MAG TPA: DsbA family protein [Rhodothermales bacterium]|nr:DsbA family protein [Rhodothermales bacterium]
MTIALAFTTSIVTAQSVESATAEDLKRDIESLRSELAKVRKDLDEVRSLAPIHSLIEENRPLDVVVEVVDYPTAGAQTSPLTIVEFSDFQCPYCGRYSRDTYPALKEKYVDQGTLKYVFMDYPLPNHPLAPKAAEAAHCADEQGQFWEMHDVLFANQNNLAEALLPGYATAIGLDETKFAECLDSGKYAAKVEVGKVEAQRLRIRGTPSFGLGYSSLDGTSVRVVRLIRGAQPLAAFEAGIEELLKSDSGSN